MRAVLTMVRPRAGERRRLTVSVLLAAAATGSAIALLAMSGYLVSRAAERQLILSVMVVIVAALAVGRAALRYVERLASHDLALRELARVRQRFFRRVAPLVPGQVNDRSRGDLLARFVADVDSLQDVYLRIVIPVLVAALVIVAASIAGALMLGPAGAALAATLGVTAILSPWASARVAAVSGRDQAPARARLTDQLIEAIDGSAELALAGRCADHVRRLKDSDDTLARLSRRDAVASALAAGLQAMLLGGGLVAVLIVAIGGVRSGALSPILLAAVVFLSLGSGEAVAPLPAAARRLRSTVVSAARLSEIAERRPAIVDPPSPQRVSGGGSLALEGVGFGYCPEAESVLSGVDLQLEPGHHVALVGPSGVGKSTLAELLVRFLDPDVGRITLDGIDIRELPQADLRSAVLLCDQEAHLFNTTIRENLLIARPQASEQELWSALGVVELDRFVRDLERGLDTLVGQQGELLSGGQRRRLALARALLSEARFLILDEPVAHLDPPLARRLMAALLARASDRGVLVITHPSDALEEFDTVLCLERGSLRPAGRLSMQR